MAQATDDSKLTVPELRVVRHERPATALGLAVTHLMAEPAFASSKFGDLSRALVGQIKRKHYCFVVDSENQIQGFLGGQSRPRSTPKRGWKAAPSFPPKTAWKAIASSSMPGRQPRRR